MRVQSIIRELRGEKIDIIEFSDDPVVFATHALSPAKVSRISIVDALEKHMEVIVDDSQLSLAIGKKGQNVRLAAKLLGWKIDIKSEEEKRQEVESQMAALVAPGAPVSVLLEYGLPEIVVQRLVETGIGTIEKLGGMTPEELEEFGQAMVEQIQESVNAYYSQFEDPAPAEAAAPVEESAAAVEEAVAPAEPAGVEETAEVVQTEEEPSGRIEDAGSPTHKPSEGTDSEETVLDEGTPEGSGH
jgi:N utilization substance protein A